MEIENKGRAGRRKPRRGEMRRGRKRKEREGGGKERERTAFPTCYFII